MYLQAAYYDVIPSSVSIALTCPNCGSNGHFNNVINSDVYLANSGQYIGLRKCPNSSCLGIIFFVKAGDNVLLTTPSLRIDFNSDNIPESILKIFSEAITCHSQNCFIASGMMIRKTLEAICEDKGAIGQNLHQKIESLKKIITIPNELLEAMNELKLLGNDAAHIVAKDFEEIGNNEIEISIEFTKEILKSVYQYQTLLSKLRGLKKPTI